MPRLGFGLEILENFEHFALAASPAPSETPEGTFSSRLPPPLTQPRPHSSIDPRPRPLAEPHHNSERLLPPPPPRANRGATLKRRVRSLSVRASRYWRRTCSENDKRIEQEAKDTDIGRTPRSRWRLTHGATRSRRGSCAVTCKVRQTTLLPAPGAPSRLQRECPLLVSLFQSALSMHSSSGCCTGTRALGSCHHVRLLDSSTKVVGVPRAPVPV